MNNKNPVERLVKLTPKEMNYVQKCFKNKGSTGSILCRKLREDPNDINPMSGKSYLKILAKNDLFS